MTQTFNKIYQGTRQQVMIEEEHSVMLPQPTNVAANVITFAAGALTAIFGASIVNNLLVGQHVMVLQRIGGGGALMGWKFTVVANTTNTITLEESVQGTTKWTSIPSDLSALDRLAVTMRGIRPGVYIATAVDYQGNTGGAYTDFANYTVTEMFGIVDSSSLPDPKHTVDEKFAIGSADMPRRHVEVYQGTGYDNSWPLAAIHGKRLLGVFGKVTEHASSFDAGATTLTQAAYPGEVVLQMAAAGGIVANDYIEINNGGDTNGEIRRVVATPAAGIVTLDKPLRRYHAIGEDVNEVHANCLDYTNAAYITHSYTIAHSVPTYCIGVNMKAELDDVTAENWFLAYLGHTFSEGSFKTATASELTIDVTSDGLNARRDRIACPTIDTSLFYISGAAKKVVHFSRSYILFDGVKWNTPEDFSLTITRAKQVKSAINYVEESPGYAGYGLEFGLKPHSVVTGRANMKVSVAIPVHNKQIWDLLNTRQPVTFTHIFSIPRSTTFNEIWTWTVTTSYPEEAGLELTADPSPTQTFSALPHNVTLTIVDKIPYY